MEQENNRHETDDEGFFEEIALQCFDRCLYQSRPVTAGHNLDPGRKRRFDLGKPFLNTVDHVKGIHSVTHHNDSTNCFPFAVPLCDTLANVGTKCYCAKITNKDGCTVLRGDGHGFEVL